MKKITLIEMKNKFVDKVVPFILDSILWISIAGIMWIVFYYIIT